jgi:hypothetical protein
MCYLDKNAILESLSKEDIKKVVMSLGSDEPKIDNSGNLLFQTICHNHPDPNNSYKLYYYHEPNGEHKGKLFHCYSGCNDSFGIIELVIRAKRNQGSNLTWYKALRYIAQITGKIITSSAEEIEQKSQRIDDFTWINRLKNIKKKQKAVPTLTEINENILDIFCYYPWKPWTEDHISAEAMSQFEIGYYGYQHSLTIPHRDINGRLIGIRQRLLDEWEIENIGKYVPVQIENKFLAHSLGNNLYGAHIVKDKVQRCKKIMLVESEKGAMQSYSYFGDDSFTVSVCGSNITRNQMKMIMGLGVEEVMVAFDRMYTDPQSFEAEIYLRKLIKWVAPLVPFVRVYLILDNEYRIPYKQSPTDMGKDILVQLMKEKTLVTMDMVREILEEEKESRKTNR